MLAGIVRKKSTLAAAGVATEVNEGTEGLVSVRQSDDKLYFCDPEGAECKLLVKNSPIGEVVCYRRC